MNLPFYIAGRYLFSKKSHNAINVISLVSVCGVIVSTIALAVILSVFNGFESMVGSMFSNFDPELKVTPRIGKVFDPNTPELAQMRKIPGVDVCSEVLQDNAWVQYRDRQVIVVLKGVDSLYKDVTRIEDILIDGQFTLEDKLVNYAIPGITVANQLGVNARFVTPLEISVPKRDATINTANVGASFNRAYAYVGAVFQTNQVLYDDSHIIVPISLARELFHYDNEVSAIEISLTPNANLKTVKKEIQKLLGADYIVANRHEQQTDTHKMMQMEKWITYLILSFILAIAVFNVVGSLSMLIIEKKEDIRTLRNMGARPKLIRNIFLFEGWMISGLGAVIGIIIGVALCLLQQHFGLIKLGSAGAFAVASYPVQVVFSDIVIVLLTVLGIGFLAAWYPVRQIK